jgi:hypothetical protein
MFALFMTQVGAPDPVLGRGVRPKTQARPGWFRVGSELGWALRKSSRVWQEMISRNSCSASHLFCLGYS